MLIDNLFYQFLLLYIWKAKLILKINKEEKLLKNNNLYQENIDLSTLEQTISPTNNYLIFGSDIGRNQESSSFVFPVTIEVSSNPSQKAGASHSNLVTTTLITTIIHESISRFPCCLVSNLHPSSLTPQLSKLFLWIRMLTLGQSPLLMCRHPLSPILFHPEFLSIYLC